jgi:hypothetical protein
MNCRCLVFVIMSVWVVNGRAQFSAGWLQNPLWSDGKAEFNIYEAQQVRYGRARSSEVTHIFVQEPFAPDDLVKAEDGSRKGAFPVLKLNQILHIPTGVYVYQQMHSAFWDIRDGALVKASLTSNDSCGNTYKEFRALHGWRGWFGAGWRYEWRTYWEGMSRGEETVRTVTNATFYDELPMRVRTIDFTRERGEFEIALAPTIIGSKKDNVQWKSATVRWQVQGETIDLTVSARAGVMASCSSANRRT